MTTATFASAADTAEHGAYGPGRLAATRALGRPDYPFQGRVGSPEFPAEPGRYHLYVAWTCPFAQRAAITRALLGLQDVIGQSAVDDDRDGRGWAFRVRRGPDAANGFALLSEAYEATEPGYPGHISVPVLWDTETRRIVSNDYPQLTLDLATQFDRWADPEIALYPVALRPRIDELVTYVDANISHGVGRVAAAATQADYHEARGRVADALERLDALLGEQAFLVGETLTEADVRLWVTLARYDLVHNPRAGITERRLADFPNLWLYARDLYLRPAFRETTDFPAIARGATPATTPGVTRLQVAPSHADWGP